MIYDYKDKRAEFSSLDDTMCVMKNKSLSVVYFSDSEERKYISVNEAVFFLYLKIENNTFGFFSKNHGHDYTRRNNESLDAWHTHLIHISLSLRNRLGVTLKEILENEHAMIRANTRIKPDDNTNENGNGFKENRIVIKYIKTYAKTLQLPLNVEAYIQFIVLKKTVETISFNRRRELETSLCVILGAEMPKQPTSSLKQADNGEDGDKTENRKNILPLILNHNHRERTDNKHKRRVGFRVI
ncbi:hypothetical protein CWI38_1004p0020 [Hamiltosporidium tvaerminnensis]|uniref:Uncharacterized protein n=1 Tax=Hamiltosporidium tvaerminnensis TaxID=1176355 RepID=A0A4Q9LTF1_9MICR|nr:hypothetical protein CWI38_1004p0020 [Hamiltosporidium tvaerminnensis]